MKGPYTMASRVLPYIWGMCNWIVDSVTNYTPPRIFMVAVCSLPHSVARDNPLYVDPEAVVEDGAEAA